MKIKKFSQKPSDLKDRIGAKPIVCYPNTNIEEKNLGKNSINQLDKLLRNNIQEMNNNTKKLYENFKNLMTT